MASRILRIALLAASASQTLASCAYGTHLRPREESADGEIVVKVGEFGYLGTDGPLNWLALDPVANQACASGTRQSPIDMTPDVFQVISGADISLDIPDMLEGTEFENLGTTVEIIAKGGSMVLGGTNYTLQQFHFHLPSEHLDNGTSMAMEMHMVWESEDQEIAVIGVFIDLDTEKGEVATPINGTQTPGNSTLVGRQFATGVQYMGITPTLAVTPDDSVLLETVFNSVEEIEAPGTFTETAPLVMSELVEVLNAGNYQSYSGSLTTPPCSEGVSWLVSTQKLLIQTATFDRVRSVLGYNARFPQNSPGEVNLLQLASVAAKR